jgi:hypothetical protein
LLERADPGAPVTKVFSMSFFDFVVDLMWGALEVFLAKRRARKAGSNAQAVEGPKGERWSALSEQQATREKTERLIGTKTV